MPIDLLRCARTLRAEFYRCFWGQIVQAEPAVHIVDDDLAYLDSLTQLIGSMGFKTVSYSSADDFLSRFGDQAPGCLVLDLKLRDQSGFSILDELSKRSIAPPVIIVTAYADVPAVVRSFRVGAVAFLQKQSLGETTLFEALQRALDLDVQQRSAHLRRHELQKRLQLLTVPETLVLNLLLDGSDHKKIAEVLDVSRRTVENRRARIMTKLGASTFPELVRIVIESGHRSGGR